MSEDGRKVFPLAGKRVYVAGHAGMVGSAVARRLAASGVAVLSAPRAALDLRDQAAVNAFLERERPDAVVIAAAVVGGIKVNAEQPARFLHDNLAIADNLIHGAHRAGIGRLLFLGAACMYPRLAAQPIGEDSLLTGPLEPTNEAYAVAKIAGLKLCQAYRQQHGRDYIVAVPTNLYGPGDNFSLEAGHVVPAMIRKLVEARGGPVEIWGTGTPRREFLHVDDAADAIVFLLERYSDPAPINIGQGHELSIRELAETVAGLLGHGGGFRYLTDRPDGMPLKALAPSRLAAMGWTPKRDFGDGLAETIAWFRSGAAKRL